MELRVLRYFLAVAEEENITAASEKLHLTQPTLSKQLMDLEAELGKKLFVRGKRKTTLTEDGAFLKKRAEEIIGLADKTEADFHSDDRDLGGDVYIGGGETEGMRFVAKAMKRTTERHPHIHFHLYSGDEESIAEQLGKGLLDFGLFVGTADLGKYDYIRLPSANRFGVLMRKDDILAQNDVITQEMLDGLPIISPRQVMRRNDLSGWFGHKMERLNIIGTYNLLYNASLMVEEGMGYALCIDGVVNSDALCYRPLMQETSAGIIFAWQKYQAFSKQSRKFLEILKESV